MDDASPLAARSFEPSAQARWLLCGAAGSGAVFTLPWGRDSDASDAEASFPSAVELLCAPSLQLEPTPVHGVRGIHRIETNTWRAQIATALGVAAERDFFCGPAAVAGCELLLVLSDKALHVVLQATPTGAPGDETGHPEEPPSPSSSPAAAAVSATAKRAEALTPLVAHLLPSTSSRITTAAAIMDGSSQLLPQAGGGQAAGEVSSPASATDAAALHARIAALEERAIGAERRLADLHTSFSLFAHQSRQQTDALVGALERLAARR
jgi:hypothetical protein